MIKAVLYDLDGVLVDAVEWHYESLNRALRRICGFTIQRDEHLATFNGLPTLRKLEILRDQGRIPQHRFGRVWDLKQAYTTVMIAEHSEFDRGKIALHRFTKAAGIASCCVTNATRKTAELMLESTGQLHFMRFLVCNEDVQKNKPDPEPYLRAMQILELTPDQCLIVEDSPKGRDSARAAGAHLWAVEGVHDVTRPGFVLKLNSLRIKL